MEIRIDPKKVLYSLLGVLVLLLALNLIGLIPIYTGAREVPWKIFSFDDEQNIPVLFSTANLVLCGLLAWGIACGFRSVRKKALQWGVLAGVFFYLAIDEFIMIHERIAHLMRILLHQQALHDAGWVVPYAVLVIAFAALYLKFFLQLPKKTKMLLILGGALFVFGAIGMECIGCIWWKIENGKDVVYYLFATAEETLEMLGVLAVQYALFNFISECQPDLSLAVTPCITSDN